MFGSGKKTPSFWTRTVAKLGRGESQQSAMPSRSSPEPPNNERGRKPLCSRQLPLYRLLLKDCSWQIFIAASSEER
jgi:hypothetical protein